MVTKEESPVTPVALVAKENLNPKLSPDSTSPASHNDREVNTSIVPEKPSEDGYNWRKYGQKNVKGNEYIKSYYKCSNPNCHVKKQVERSQDGRITDVTYLGNHDHDKPHSEPDVPSLLSAQVQMPACPPAVQEEKPADMPAPAIDNVQPMNESETLAVVMVEDAVTASATPSTQRRDDHNEILTPKKRKKVDSADITPEKLGNESRLVVQTVSEVDIVNDGYRWRKYGQKMVKGNPNPRSYYRCSTAGCPVKKHVERASYDPKIVITTYENQHDHSMPPVRTIVPQTVTPSGGMDSNGQDKSKSEESDAAQNTPRIETDKADAIDPAAKEKNNLAIVVKTQNEEISNVQELLKKAKNADHTENTAHEGSGVEVQAETKPDVTKSEQQVQDPPSTAPVDVKPEVLLTEQKTTDAILGSSLTKTASNGQQRTSSEPVNC